MENLGNQKQFNKKWLLAFMIVAFIFSVLMRYIWIDFASNIDEYKFNNTVMINTNDGYYYAEGARDIIAGFHQENDLSPVSSALPQLTAFLAKILPFSFESIILWLPSVLSSLVVIPILLIARLYKFEFVGFLGALFASIAASYYYRTMAGYYDTDMLVIVFAMFALWAILINIYKRNDIYLLVLFFIMIGGIYWYPQNYSLYFALFAITLAYSGFNYFLEKKYDNIYLKIAIFILLSVLFISLIYKVILAIIVFFIFKTKKINTKILSFIVLGLILFQTFLGGFHNIIYQIITYLKQSSELAQTQLHYYAVMQTIMEVQAIAFDYFSFRISGSEAAFLVSCVGYIFLLIKHPSFLISTPLVGLGFLAYIGGLRFTIYAVPIFAISLAYLIYYFSQKVSEYVRVDKYALLTKYLLCFLLMGIAIYPNIKNINNYKIKTTFFKDEVKTLDSLKHKAQREDYVISWWDYGYPIRYYSDVKTLVDGGKHHGYDNYYVSLALSNNQNIAANMARLSVEYTERNFKENFGDIILQMSKDYGFKNANDFIYSLNDKSLKLPKKTRDIYFYLPLRMLDIFPTVSIFSNIDLDNGNVYNNFFYKGYELNKQNDILHLINDSRRQIAINLKTGEIKGDYGESKIKQVSTVALSQDGRTKAEHFKLNEGASLYLVVLKSYGYYLILDEMLFNSIYIQHFFFDNYDKNLYELVLSNPYAKIFKLKK